MFGAGWDKEANALAELQADEPLYTPMPPLHLRVVPADEDQTVDAAVYECPIFSTAWRGDDPVLTAMLRVGTGSAESPWPLATHLVPRPPRLE